MVLVLALCESFGYLEFSRIFVTLTIHSEGIVLILSDCSAKTWLWIFAHHLQNYHYPFKPHVPLSKFLRGYNLLEI